MNFSISNICLEASFFERECAPKITLKSWTFSCLKKSKENRGNRKSPEDPSRKYKWCRAYRNKDHLQGNLFGLSGVTEVLVDPSMKGRYQGLKDLLSDTPPEFPSIAKEYQNLYPAMVKRSEILIEIKFTTKLC